MENVAWTIVNPSWTQPISRSKKCSTHLRDWCLNKMGSQDWKQLGRRIIHGNTCHWLVNKGLSIFNARKTSFRILCCALGRVSKILNLTMLATKMWMDLLFSKIAEILTASTVTRWNSSGIFSQNSVRCSLLKNRTFTAETRTNTREFHKKNSVSVDVQRHFLWNERQWKRMLGKCSTRLCMQKNLEPWSFIGPFSEKWYCVNEDNPQGAWDIERKKCQLNSLRTDVQFSALRTHCPEINSKTKDMENCRYTLQQTRKRFETVFGIIVSANQLSLYGAKADMCEEYETLHRSMRPDVVMGQSSSSIVLSVIKTEFFFRKWWPNVEKFSVATTWIELTSCHNKTNWVSSVLCKISECCWEWTVFHDERHWRSHTISCSSLSWIHSSKTRTSITPKRMDPKEHKNWPVWEVAICYLHSKFGVEIRISSVNRDNTHSWVRIPHGSKKCDEFGQ